jgi:predicted PurR-regulated permease PerM
MTRIFFEKISLSLFIVSILLLGAILAKDVLLPLVLGFFLSYLIYPVVWKIEKAGVPRVFSILIVLLVTVIIIGTIILLVSVKISHTTINLSDFKDQADQKTNTLMNFIESNVGLQASTIKDGINQIVDKLFSSLKSKAGQIFTTTTTTIFQIVILPVFTFFILFYRTKTAYFIFRLAGRKNKYKALQILREISKVTTKYMSGVFIVIFILAVLNSTGLYIIGVEYALIFGILSAFLNLIPYFGTLLGGFIPIMYVLITSPKPFQTILQIIILFIIVQFLENNILTPNIVGGNIKINPFAIILSLLLANMIWGVAGMIIVVPCLAMAKIVMRNIESLQPFAFLISDEGVEKYQINFSGNFSNYKLKVKQLWEKIKYWE